MARGRGSVGRVRGRACLPSSPLASSIAAGGGATHLWSIQRCVAAIVTPAVAAARRDAGRSNCYRELGAGSSPVQTKALSARAATAVALLLRIAPPAAPPAAAPASVASHRSAAAGRRRHRRRRRPRRLGARGGARRAGERGSGVDGQSNERVAPRLLRPVLRRKQAEPRAELDTAQPRRARPARPRGRRQQPLTRRRALAQPTTHLRARLRRTARQQRVRGWQRAAPEHAQTAARSRR